MIKLSLKNIQKKYGDVEVLKNINLDINDGEFIILIGSSGCGKSTLLRIISGLEQMTSGDILVDGESINNTPPQKRNMAMVFQSYALYPHMSVFKNISYSLRISKKFSKAEIKTKVERVAKILGMQDLLDRYPKALSGGQRQRVAMGRAIIRQPGFFLFDEPLSNLDAKLRIVMRKEIKELQKQLKTTTVYVTHDQVEAMTMADKIVLMHDGDIIQSGAPKDIFDNPNCVYVAKFLGSPAISIIDGAVKIENGIKYFYTANTNIKMPIKQIDNLQDGQKIKLGIRPNDFTLAEKNNEDQEINFTIDIDVCEYTGSETVIYAKLDGFNINILTNNKDIINETQIVVNYNTATSNIFDYETELNLESNANLTN